MNTESMQCHKVLNGEMNKPGDFCFDESKTNLYLWLPGENNPDCIPIIRGTCGVPRIWGWDGNEDKPTITPSILATGQWHGYLRDGRLISC
jgi:hypothetical protein